ncbi:unnamed protein product [Heterotrigona itama]|uniref:NtA domain-containing protein n=1 Tax=Heterotrigona itama TaxID=395501 RepID=A0A6V7GZ22_9HYME|nr:unnamed protein product [Heterotrigona itama]
MSRSIAAVFIFVALAVQATFALIDYSRETVTLELTDEDLVQTIPDTYLERHAAVHLGNLYVGKHVAGEETYSRMIAKENTHDIILLYTLKLKMNGKDFLSLQNKITDKRDHSLLRKETSTKKEKENIQMFKYRANVSFTGVINFVTVHNVKDSQAVVCVNENALGRSEGSIVVRIAPHSVAKLNVLVGMHRQ